MYTSVKLFPFFCAENFPSFQLDWYALHVTVLENPEVKMSFTLPSSQLGTRGGLRTCASTLTLSVAACAAQDFCFDRVPQISSRQFNKHTSARLGFPPSSKDASARRPSHAVRQNSTRGSTVDVKSSLNMSLGVASGSALTARMGHHVTIHRTLQNCYISVSGQ